MVLNFSNTIGGLSGLKETTPSESTFDCQPVANPGFGEEEFWIGRIVFKFLPQLTDVDS